MKRRTLLGIALAAAVAAIVVLTTGAFGGTSGRSGQPGDSFTSCLAAHGVQVPSDDPSTVKQWLADHQSDPAVQAALAACSSEGAGTKGKGKGTEPGPTTAALVACLERHGVDVPSNASDTPAALKPWLVGVMDQPDVKAALDDCTGGPAPGGKKK